MRAGALFRLLFLPELGRGLGGARESLARLRSMIRATPPIERRPPSLRCLLFPAGRASMALGVLLALGCGLLTAYGVSGLGEAGAQGVQAGLFAVEDLGTRRLLDFLDGLELSGRTVLGEMLEVFNYGVLTLVGFLLIWHTVTGSVATAREGRWGFGAWEVMRIVLAVALMWPLAGGASGAQLIAIGLAKLGGDFATAVWKPVAVESLGKGRSIAPWPREREWRTVIVRTLLSEVCMHAANEEARAAGDAAYVALNRRDVTRPFRGTTRGAAARRGVKIGETAHYDGVARGLPGSVCGSVTFVGLNEDGARGIAARAHRLAWSAVQPSVRNVAMEVGDHYVAGSASYGKALPDIGALLDGVGAAEAYRAALELGMKEAAAVGQAELEKAIGEDAVRMGWVSAASFVNTLSRSAGRIRSAARNIPQAGLFSEELEAWSPQGWAAVQGVVKGLQGNHHYQLMPIGLVAGIGSGRAAVEGRGGSLLRRVMNFIDPETVMVAESGNPMLDLANMGYGLIESGLAVMAALAGVSVGNNFFEGIPWIGKGLDVFEASWQVMDGIVTPVVGILLVGGAVLAYVVPAIPFIRFLFGILGWLLSVIEALLAVTVFCAAHVTRGEGDRLMIEGTRQGWLLLPALILRPVLMLFGLVLGYFLFLAAMGLFNEIWLPRVRDVTGSSGLDVIDFVALLVLYVIVAYGIVNASFKAIDLLPGAVLEWIGASGRGEAEGDGAIGTSTGGFGRLAGLRMGYRARPGPAAQGGGQGEGR